MRDINIEDTVICMDVSRSMFKKDFAPNRISVVLSAVKNFIHTKIAIDPKDRIALLSIGKTTKKLSLFTEDEQFLIESLEKIQISGKGHIIEGIAFSLQLIIEEMRKIGGKIFRIFLISDQKANAQINEKLEKILNVARGLGVYIDTCQLGKSENMSKSVLKKIAQLTDGDFGYFNNLKALVNAGKSFASKKTIKQATDFFSPHKKIKIPPLVNEVAIPLKRPTVSEVRLMMSEKDEDHKKCQICHSTKSPMTGADFYSEGRYCPSCERPMHLSCAAMWAKKTEYQENVFRCPSCYFLLKLPKNVPNLVKEKENEASSLKKPKKLEGMDLNQTKLVKIPEEEILQINASCSYCNSIFLGENQVFKCEKCGSYYHEPCLEKMYKEIKACRNCGAQIIFNS